VQKGTLQGRQPRYARREMARELLKGGGGTLKKNKEKARRGEKAHSRRNGGGIRASAPYSYCAKNLEIKREQTRLAIGQGSSSAQRKSGANRTLPNTSA